MALYAVLHLGLTMKSISTIVYLEYHNNGTSTSNWKSVPLTVLELLAFNTKNLAGHVTLATLPFENFLRRHVRTVPGNMHGRFEVRSFNHFKLV